MRMSKRRYSVFARLAHLLTIPYTEEEKKVIDPLIESGWLKFDSPTKVTRGDICDFYTFDGYLLLMRWWDTLPYRQRRVKYQLVSPEGRTVDKGADFITAQDNPVDSQAAHELFYELTGRM